MILIQIAIILFLLFLLVCGVLDYKKEKSNFNNGYCNCCGSKLNHFINDSHGSRGYICDKCNTSVWISYNSIDKEFLKNDQKNL